MNSTINSRTLVLFVILVFGLALSLPVFSQETVPAGEEETVTTTDDSTSTNDEATTTTDGTATTDDANTGTTTTGGGTTITSNGGGGGWKDIISFFQSFLGFILKLIFGIDINGGGLVDGGNTGIIGTGGGDTGNTGTDGTGTTGTTGTTGSTTQTSTAAAKMAEISSAYGITIANGQAKDLGQGDRVTAGAWDENELATLEQVLKSLPASFRANCPKIENNGQILSSQVGSALGLADPQTHQVWISDNQGGELAGTIVHEMTHSFQFKNPNVETQWANTFWANERPKTSSVSDYGNTNVAEDMAESVRVYYVNGASMKQSDPDRYEFVKTQIMGGVEF